MLLMGGKPKGGPPMGDDDEDDTDDAPESGGSTEDALAGEAFDAFKDGDREGFIAAFKSAVKACAGKADAGGYDEDDSAEGF